MKKSTLQRVYESQEYEKIIDSVIAPDEIISQPGRPSVVSGLKSNVTKDAVGWLTKSGVYSLAISPNSDYMASGLYNISYDQSKGSYAVAVDVITDDLIIPPTHEIDQIISDLEKFWTRQDVYKKFGINYKRAHLYYGPPGTGKSSLINVLCQIFSANYDGVIINMNDVGLFTDFMGKFRAVEPNRKVFVIIEDMDGFLNYNSVKDFLNLLDGNCQFDNVVYVATTNYIDRLEPRIKDRPSRFDRKFEIGPPSTEAKSEWIRSKIAIDPTIEQKIDIDKWMSDTTGMSFAHLKELFISIIILDLDYDDVMFQLKSMPTI